MSDRTNNVKLLELAPAEISVPLKVSHAGRSYRVRHVLRPPAPADWFAYEAALQMAVEELPPEADSAAPDAAEPSYRLEMRSSDAALELWNRLVRRVEGYALSTAALAKAGLPSGHDFSRAETSAPQEKALASEVGQVGQGFSPDKKDSARSATWEGVRGNPPSGCPDDSGTDWRPLIPLAHKEAVVRALTLVAAAQPDSTNSQPASNPFPLFADEVPVVLEAVVGGVAYPRLVHRFRPPSVDAERAYRRLLAENLIVRGTRRPRTLIPSRLPALVRLYDELLLDVEGYAVGGQPLDSSPQAVRHMDAWHKRVALQALFGDLAADAQAARLPSTQESPLRSVPSSELPE